MSHPATAAADTTAVLCDPATPSATLVSAHPSDALFALALLANDKSLRPPEGDPLRRRGRSLFATHPRQAALGDLFLATLVDRGAAVSAMNLLNSTLCTWAILVDLVRRHDLTDAHLEATTEDVVEWLARNGHTLALEQAVRLAVTVGDQGGPSLVRWLDSAWAHVSDVELLADALSKANALTALPVADRLVELASSRPDGIELLDRTVRTCRTPSAAQRLLLEPLAGHDRLLGVIRTPRLFLDEKVVVPLLTEPERLAVVADPSAPEYIRQACISRQRR